jgi:exonuclease SbcC
MKFNRIHLTNYRCFESETIDFEPGVNVIHGRNGSGKSTILEACFFALYGSNALREGDANLEDIITNETDTTTVTLELTHNNEKYTVKREVRERSGRVTQAVCELETPDETFTGATAVDPAIASMVRMDATAFLNCAYVRQGEIEKLINASASERQTLIDKLLQLGRLKTYKERASDIRVGAGRVRDRKLNLRDDREDEIGKREADSPNENLSHLNSELDALNDELDSLREKKQQLQDTLTEAKNTVEEYEGLQEEIKALEGDIDEQETEIEGLEKNRIGYTTAIEEKKAEVEQKESELISQLEQDAVEVSITADASIAELEEKREALNDVRSTTSEALAEKRTTRDTLREEQERLEEGIETARENAEGAADQAEERQRLLENELLPELESLRTDIKNHEERIGDLQGKLEASPYAPEELSDVMNELQEKRGGLVDQRSSVRGDKKAAQSELDRAEELQEKGKCPECGQDIEGAPHVDRMGELEGRIETLTSGYEELNERIETVDENIEAVDALQDAADELRQVAQKKQSAKDLAKKQQQAIDDAEDSVREYRSAVEEYREETDEYVERREDVSDELAELTEQITDVEQREEIIRGRRKLVGGLISTHGEIDELESEVRELEKDHKHAGEMLESKREVQQSLVEEKQNMEAEMDSDALEDAQESVSTIDDDISEVESDIASIESERSDKQQKKGQIQSAIERLRELREEKAGFDDDVQALTALYEQMQDVEQMYTELRGDLRQRNVRHLERLLNEMFDLVYQNDSYGRIELDGEYNATILEKTDAGLDPQKLSGGESALFNLSLRCAIYQLLVEGIEGTAPMPPLILDEPTAHLDEGHIGRIDNIVRRMRDIGVEQMIVVSHTEEIIDSSNHRIKVEQTPATNRSEAVADSARII